MSNDTKPAHPGSLFLFQAFRIPVFVHWSWGLLLAFFIMLDPLASGAFVSTLALIGLFAIVVLHEYGHALAAKSVGGQADRIVLMPLGGIAYIQPPPRPWPFLWSVAAGPLVNVLLLPVFAVLVAVLGATPQFVEATNAAGQTVTQLDTSAMSVVQLLTFYLASINLALLVFNLLPIFPLDGGQIVQGVLWLFMGRASSLKVSATVGLIASLSLGMLMVLTGFQFGNWLLFFIAIFLALQSLRSLAIAKMMAKMERQHGRHVEPWELRRGVRPSEMGGPLWPGGGGGGRRRSEGGDVIEGEVVDRQ